MKKKVLTFLAFASVVSANAQSYLGYTHDNYAGVQGVLFNPASIVDSRFKTDINLFSVSSMANNDAYGVNLMDAFKSDYDFENKAKKSFALSNNAMLNTDIMGPSFMFNIAPKHSLAVYTRARSFVNVLDINGNLIDELAKDNTSNFDYSVGSPNAVGNSWGELGVSYAAVLFQKGAHFVKGGVTAKYLQGVANYHFQANNVQVKYVKNSLNPQNSQYTSTGTALYGSSQDFAVDNDVVVDSKSRGLGLDLGFIYEWRPDYEASRSDLMDLKHINKYKLRFGLALTDLGSVRYDKGIRNSYDLNATVTQGQYDSAEDADAFLKNNYTATVVNGAVKAFLPTTLRADVDWNLHNKFYLNANGEFSVVDKSKLNQNSSSNRFSLTPRYESRWFSFYMPVSYIQYSKQAQVGVGLRTGIFFIGSGSALTNLMSDNSRAVDMHLGFKIPVYQKKKKQVLEPVVDKIEEVDEVMEEIVAEEILIDTDGDSIVDEKDRCPEIAGPVANNGCPWEDSDGDGVPDKDDQCPEVRGAMVNNGCPEITGDVIKELNVFSKAVLFNSGKATIRPESNPKLQEIENVMRNYPTANFRLEGYTDSTGSAVKNLQLSKERAAAVKTHLVAKGISADRLSSEGFGIVKPIATNKTEAGRAANRRVEIILVK
ncbi:DUF5723 family protein [Flavobacterium crassostreae]|uniref:OmpA-like domain-containing protein n=1 Tax=Flavobacterium crassostreae TaxID=1763534 RepID=A0A1B9E8W5_9FLAO|nr:DUF5723 family protein [Flavobacterium crassostreae]OCB78395.1 hypothetical protein LPBF_02385 [Flavobacterium crassostreae]